LYGAPVPPYEVGVHDGGADSADTGGGMALYGAPASDTGVPDTGSGATDTGNPAPAYGLPADSG